MLTSSAIAGLQQSIQDAESAIAAMAEELKAKRSEIRRYRKALAVLTVQPPKAHMRRGASESNVPAPDQAVELN